MQEDPAVSDYTLDSPGLGAFLGTLRVATDLTTRADAELRNLGAGIKASDWDILALLVMVGPLRPSELVKRSSLSGNPTTVSTILGRLEDRGDVERRPLDDDPRGVVVHVTEDGRDLFERVFPVLITKLVGPYALHFTDDELETLNEFWERF